MAHINHIRMVDQLRRLSIRDAIDPRYLKSFAAFCGSRYQRNQVGIHEMSAFCGNMGIVLLHNDLQIEADLFQLQESLGNISPDFQMYLANPLDSYGGITSFYDPFYGLSESAILDALVPPSPGSVFSLEEQSVRSILSDYLSIMQYQFYKDRHFFGDYAYNLDLLLQLTELSYTELFNSVLNRLPSDLRNGLSGRLSIDGAQQKAHNAVLSFASGLQCYFWTKRDYASHSRLSIISAVRSRNLISIYIPESRNDVLNYIALELQQLNNHQVPYLLIENGLNLNASARLKSLFLSDHDASPYYTGILAENTSGIISSDNSMNDLSSLFSQTQEMFVFQCSSTIAAQPFSDGIGSYYRQLQEYHSDTHSEPFRFFQSHTYGDSQREISERMINPEELTSLGDGCLLYGKDYPIPTLINHFII